MWPMRSQKATKNVCAYMTLDMCCAVLLFHMLFIILVCIANTHLHNVPVVVLVKLFFFFVSALTLIGVIIFDLAFAFFSLQFIFHQFKNG